MPRQESRIQNVYGQVELAVESRQAFLKNVLDQLGFIHFDMPIIKGRSGIEHKCEAIGIKDQRVLIVIGGAENEKNRKSSLSDPREQMEEWKKQSLLSLYDVKSLFEQQRFAAEILLFQNVFGFKEPKKFEEFETLVHENALPFSVTASFQRSAKDITVMPVSELVEVATSVGASFLTLNDFSIEEISLFTTENTDKDTKNKITEILKLKRFYQYFYPTTDELILSSYALSDRRDMSMATVVVEEAIKLDHKPSSNALVSADPNNPVETLEAIRDMKYVNFEHETVVVTETGQKIVQKISRTAQGSFIDRVISSVTSGAIKAILDWLSK
ncbi:MAG: hypothetical protein ACP5VS_12940 [Desulfomonilaceae bacterium]